LWAGPNCPARSRELTPLYVDRFSGIRRTTAWSTHDFWEFSCALSGRGIIEAPTNLALEPDVVCLLPPRMRHREHSDESMDTIWIGLLGERMNGLAGSQPMAVRSPELARTIEEMWGLAQRHYAAIGPELDALAALVLARFLKLAAAAEQPRSTDAMDKAAEYLAEHHGDEIAMDSVARRFGYSEGYFYRAFKKRTGLAPNRYLTRIRITQAMRWLRESARPIAHVAAAVGYPDALYFSRVFRAHLGLSPSAYRSRAQSRLHLSPRKGR
jgi:AraC-like DNA-binding protein